MKSLFVVFFINHLIGLLQAQDCSTKASMEAEFGNYMQCVKQLISESYSAYEKEVREQTRQAVTKCFDPSVCSLTLQEIGAKAWDPNGANKDCPICLKFLGGVVATTLNTPSEDQRCIRQEVGRAIVREAQGCLHSKHVDFQVPPIPDLEERSAQFRENVVAAISDYVHIRNRIFSCSRTNKAAAKAVERCLRKPFPGFLSTHCTALHTCDDRTPPGCKGTMAISKKSMCTCIRDARNTILKRFGAIGDILRNVIGGARRGPAIGAGSELNTCVTEIKRQMTTSSNNWFDVIDQALSKCIRNRPPQGVLSMDSILQLGCKSILKDRSEQARTHLARAFVMVGSFVDAMSDRSSRFCGSHCAPH